MADANDNLVQQYKIICPSPNELSVINNNIKCNQCGLIFKNESSLRFHDVKSHQRKNLEKTDKEIKLHYHCPEQTCVYAKNSSKHFTTMKYLKQHYLKVHADKRYSCTQCDKCFSTEAAKLAHIRVCGLEFTCSCLKVYPSYEALLTHARRQTHYVDDKYKNMFRKTNSSKVSLPSAPLIPPLIPLAQYFNIGIAKKPITILPYKENFTIAKCEKPSTCDSSTQTDDIKKSKKISTLAKINKRRESRQTQTNYLSKGNSNKYCRKTVETQTTSSIREAVKKTNRKSKQTSSKHTTTAPATTTTTTTNNNDNNIFSHEKSSLELHDDIDLQYYWNQRNTSSDGTQTDNVSILLDDVFNNSSMTYPQDYYDVTRISDPLLTEENFSSIETQTEQPSSTPSSLMFQDFELTSTNIETQTTEDYNDIEQLIYTNMCTQTCNEILPSELGLSDTQTQTAWPDLEINNNSNDQTTQIHQFVGTQTSHTQTQTDLLSIFDELQ